MRAKLPWILFASSLLLNLFFAGGVVYSKVTAERLRDTPGERVQFVVEELGLTEAERERLLELRHAVSEQRARMREQGAPLRRAMIEEMRKPTLDRARVNELLRERSKLFVSHLTGVMTEMHGFLNGLEPEKKQEFLAMMERERRFLWRLLREPRREDKKKP